MKNKKNENKKFSLEKIEVAKLNKFQMRTIAGGLPDIQDPNTGTGHQNGDSGRYCDDKRTITLTTK